MEWLSEKTYRLITEHIPLSSVDLVIVRGGPRDREFLLAKRNIKPFKGHWFIPGGRILKNELVRQAVERQLRRELGVKARTITSVGPPLDFFGTNELGVRYHGILHVHVVTLKTNARITPNKENGEAKWFRKVDPRWPKAVRNVLAAAGFK